MLAGCASHYRGPDDGMLVHGGCALWSMPPLSVYAPPGLEGTVAMEMEWWAQEIGTEIFYAAPTIGSADVVIEYPVSMLTGTVGRAHARSVVGGHIGECRIEVSGAYPDLLGAAIRHELGHCLGLADDAEGFDSVMSRLLDPSASVTDQDRHLVRRLLLHNGIDG